MRTGNKFIVKIEVEDSGLNAPDFIHSQQTIIECLESSAFGVGANCKVLEIEEVDADGDTIADIYIN
jgi:hypothetical protein